MAEQSARLANMCQEGWSLVLNDLVNSGKIPDVIIGALAA
jgi:hypothetical protein